VNIPAVPCLLVRVEVLKTYDIWIETDDEDTALVLVYDMTHQEIKNQGELVGGTVMRAVIAEPKEMESEG
jgi:hypothetical protein